VVGGDLLGQHRLVVAPAHLAVAIGSRFCLRILGDAAYGKLAGGERISDIFPASCSTIEYETGFGGGVMGGSCGGGAVLTACAPVLVRGGTDEAAGEVLPAGTVADNTANQRRSR
jgi:hypothetical protein